MIYTIDYVKDEGGKVRRYLTKTVNGWLLKDGNSRNIRKFDDVASAMTWIDEERRDV